jgi:hypothetical protein
VIREQDVRMVRLLKRFDPVAVRREVEAIAPPMTYAHSQSTTSGRLERGSEEYHTGGWKYVPFTEHGKPSFLDRFPYIRDEVMPWFVAPVLRARIMVLEPGHDINPHSGNHEAREKVRYLIPLRMPAGVTYYVEDEPFTLADGEVWYLNQNKVHWVENRGAETRYVLAVDTPADSHWVRDIFARVGVDVGR